MISKDRYLYNSDPLIGQCNKIQTTANIRWQIFPYFWTFLLFFDVHVYMTTCFEGFGRATIHETAGLEP